MDEAGQSHMIGRSSLSRAKSVCPFLYPLTPSAPTDAIHWLGQMMTVRLDNYGHIWLVASLL